MRTIIHRRKLVTKIAVGLAASAASLVGLAQSAAAGEYATQTATSTTTVLASTWAGKCEAILYAKPAGNGDDLVSAGVYQSRTASRVGCKAWLNVSGDDGKSWYTIDGPIYASDPGTSSYTGWSIRSGDTFKACVQEFPSTAIRCTGWR